MRRSCINQSSSVLILLIFLLIGCAEIKQPVHHDYSDNVNCSPINGLIILTEFPDALHEKAGLFSISKRVDREFAQKVFFGHLNKYVQEMSYGKFCIKGTITDHWVKLPKPVSYYRTPPKNYETNRKNVGKLIVDTIKNVDKNINFSDYDFVAIFLAATVSEYGTTGLCGYPGAFRKQRFLRIVKKRTGHMINGGVAIFSYQAHLGTVFHDIAHVLGGVENGIRHLPHTYDNEIASKPGLTAGESFIKSQINMGLWDPMSCHDCDTPPFLPPGITSWTKLKLGWLDHKKVKTVKPGESATIILDPLEEPSSEILAVKIPISKNTYYLIENRQPIGYDKRLPNHGVLIMYADDRISMCTHGKAPAKLMNANPLIDRLRGAAFDLGEKEYFVDFENRIRIKLLQTIHNSYKILIEPNN